MIKEEKIDNEYYEVNEENQEFENEPNQNEDNFEENHKQDGNEDYIYSTWNYMFR